jgi:uncharacterized protein
MSKFQPLSFYEEPLESGYQLMPFRFSRLDESRYVLSNQAGEFAVATRPEIQDLVHRRLHYSTALYADLKSKHFILDSDSNVALDLMALKVRTKLSRLPNFTALHIFVVSLRCEHSCPYCQVSRQSDDRRAFDMSEPTALKAIDLVFQSPSPAIKIEFQGGESLLNFDLIKLIVCEAERRNLIERRDLQFVIATNLAPITEEILRFCRDHNLFISTSLDGPANLHNANRPRPGGNSHELAVAGIEKARNFLGRDRVSALMTTTSASLSRAGEIVDEYLRLGFEGLFLRPLSPYGFAIKTKSFDRYGVDDWLKFYWTGLDYILDLNRSGIRFIEYYAATILSKMLTPFEPGYVDLMNPSGIGIAAVVYNYDGDVYASDESRMLAEMGDKTFRLGNVHSSSYAEIFLSDALLDPIEESFSASAPMCSDCAFEPYCGADPVYHHKTQGSFVGHKPTSGFCQRNMAIFKGLVTRLIDRPSDAMILRSWTA